jgi:signal transduction histidine kinase
VPAEAASQPARILVVDDSAVSRKLLSRAVTNLAHDASEVADGQAALDLLRTTPMDAVLLDIEMPGMDGFAVLRILKADPQLRDVPVIVISGVEDTASIAKGIELGAEDFLPKSFEPQVLRARLNAALGRKRLRDLERAYLEQEVSLHEAQRLAGLGQLAAGLAHELNNPASASRRAAAHLRDALAELDACWHELSAAALSPAHAELLVTARSEAVQRAASAPPSDPLERAEREEELAAWLDAGGSDGAALATLLAAAGYGSAELARFSEPFGQEAAGPALRWLAHTCSAAHELHQLHDAAIRISALVDSVKTFSRMDEAPDQLVDIRAGLQETATLVVGHAGPRLRVELAADLPAVRGDPGALNQAWARLLANAVEAAGEDGEVVVQAAADNGAVVVVVEDNGPGISEDVQARMFDPFFTTKPPGAGTGMGLPTSFSIVQRHGGHMSVDSRPGRTRMTVRLPSGNTS